MKQSTYLRIFIIFLNLFTFIHSEALQLNEPIPKNNLNHIGTKDIYKNVKKILSIDKPGFGKSDYGNFDIVSIPKAYAMFLSAELMRYKQKGPTYNLTMALNSGNWLLNNSDLNQNDITGWGVPVAWDAFGDGSINEANAEYTIATGIVINALMDWIEYAPETAPKTKIIAIIKNAISPYLKESIYSTSGLYNYSLKISDRKYNCFNAAIYMAGQMQRYTQFISDKSLKNKIQISVDKVMAATLQYKKLDPKGGWYWSYSIEEGVANDLAHACYIVDGILTYIQSRGNLGKLFNSKAVLQHLDYFSNENGTQWYFKPSFYSDFLKEKTISPRLYGIGMIMHILSKYTDKTLKIKNLATFISKYKISDGLYSRWIDEDIVITEYLTYLLYGLSSYELDNNKIKDTIYLHNDDKHSIKINKIYNNIEQDEEITIPMTSLDDDNISILFNTRTFKSKINIYDNNIQLDKYEAVPIKVLYSKKYILVILRELLTNHLIVAKIERNTFTLSYDEIDKGKNTFFDFREAIILNDTLVLIVYESIKGQNTLLSYAINEKLNKTNELKLPSVKDPAGRTYEVIPKIDLLKSQDEQKLYIIGGSLFATYENGVLNQKDVQHNVKVFVESLINNKNEIFTIYKDISNKYHVYNLTKKQEIYISKPGEVIWQLEYFRNKIQYRKLGSTNDLKELFMFDFLNNKGSGSLYLGTNNIEGWSAWAQIYYLNGMLSFLELAKYDIQFYEIFKEYIPNVKKRLDLEVLLLMHQLNSKDGLQCRTFSVDRSLAIFAVQSSRFAMFLHRYLNLFPDRNMEKEYKKLQQQVLTLHQHMEVLEKGISKIVTDKWNKSDAYYLKWPKGNSFYFDGLNVPYNHQNEWATFILETTKNKKYVGIASSIINLFIDNIETEKHTLPMNAIWPYWWGKAWDGWSKTEQISEQKKEYSGDKGNGWISFRSIDAISILALALAEATNPQYHKNVIQISKFVQNGKLYPFVSTKLHQHNILPALKKEVISDYIRFTSPWELDNCVWSYLNYIKQSTNLNYKN